MLIIEKWVPINLLKRKVYGRQFLNLQQKNFSLCLVLCEKFTDYYKLLEVSPTSTQQEIKKQFYKKSKELHPDSVTSAKADQDQFIKLKLAYEVLSNIKTRKDYDSYQKSPDNLTKTYSEWKNSNTTYDRTYSNINTDVHGMRYEEKRKPQSKTFILDLTIIFTVFFGVLYVIKDEYERSKKGMNTVYNAFKYRKFNASFASSENETDGRFQSFSTDRPQKNATSEAFGKIKVKDKKEKKIEKKEKKTENKEKKKEKKRSSNKKNLKNKNDLKKSKPDSDLPVSEQVVSKSNETKKTIIEIDDIKTW